MSKYIYGIDLGGTTVKIGFFNLEGDLLDNFQIPTNKEENGKNILIDITNALKFHMNEKNLNIDDIKGVGIGVPGPVSEGVVYRCVNLGWGIVNVKQELEALLGVPVFVSNDANIAGLGELWKGGGSGYKNLVFLTLGTGVGGAVIVDGRIVDGFVGAGGEIGHCPTCTDGFSCNCGKTGCLETVASATGVVNVTTKILQETNTPSNLRNYDKLSARIIFDEAKAGDSVATEAIEIFGKNLGFVCAMVGVVTNPQAFVFGGGVSKAGEIITEVVKKYFNKYAFPGIVASTEFKLATLGNDAGIYGAAYLARENSQ